MGDADGEKIILFEREEIEVEFSSKLNPKVFEPISPLATAIILKETA